LLLGTNKQALIIIGVGLGLGGGGYVGVSWLLVVANLNLVHQISPLKEHKFHLMLYIVVQNSLNLS